MFAWLKTLFGGTDYEALADAPDDPDAPDAAPATPSAGELELWSGHADRDALLAALEADDHATLIRALLKMWRFRPHPDIGDVLAKVTAHQLRTTPRWTDEERDTRLRALAAQPDPVQLGPMLREQLDLQDGVLRTTLRPYEVLDLVERWPDDPRIPRWAFDCLESGRGGQWVVQARRCPDAHTLARARAFDIDAVHKAYDKHRRGFVSYKRSWDGFWRELVADIPFAIGPPDDRLTALDAALDADDGDRRLTGDAVERYRDQLAALQEAGDDAGAASFVDRYWDRLLGDLHPLVTRAGLAFEGGRPVAVAIRSTATVQDLEAVRTHDDWRAVRELTLPPARRRPDTHLEKAADRELRARGRRLSRSDRIDLVRALPGRRQVVRNVGTWLELSIVLREHRGVLREVHLAPDSPALNERPELARSGQRLDVLGVTTQQRSYLEELQRVWTTVGRLEIRPLRGADPQPMVEAAAGWADEVVVVGT
jgi:hypothetical protein